jgi:hypothetical protein
MTITPEQRKQFLEEVQAWKEREVGENTRMSEKQLLEMPEEEFRKIAFKVLTIGGDERDRLFEYTPAVRERLMKHIENRPKKTEE